MTAAHFYRTFPKGVKLAGNMTDEDMEMENYFLIMPKSKRCTVTTA